MAWLLQVAKEHYQKNAAEYLNELVFKDPGQKILWNDEGLQVWIGAKEAASPEFATAVGEARNQQTEVHLMTNHTFLLNQLYHFY